MRGQTLSVRFAIVDKRLRSGAPGSASYNSSGGPYTVSVSLQVPDLETHAIFWIALRIHVVCPAHEGQQTLQFQPALVFTVSVALQTLTVMTPFARVSRLSASLTVHQR